MSKEKEVYVTTGYYTRINRAIKALKDAKNYIMSDDKDCDNWIIKHLEEIMKSKTK